MRNGRPGFRPQVERFVFAAICLATLLFAIITPPFQSPDEDQHYMKALQLAEGRVLPERRGAETGAMLPRAALDLRDVDFPPEEPGVPIRYERAAFDRAWHADAGRAGERFGYFPNLANYSPTLYVPQALGLLAGEAIGLPRLGGFYLGRLFNLAAALALLWLALRLLPFGRAALLAVAALPVACYQAGSLSADVTINGLGFVGLALALRWGHGLAARPPASAILVAAPLLALAKGVYLPLMAAGLRWPQSRRDRSPWLLLAAMALGVAIFLLWMKISGGGSQTLYSIVSRKTGEATTTAPLGDQLAVILADPLGYARIVTSSMTERAPVYLLQIIGRFGWNTILMPLIAYPLALLMLGAALLRGAGARFIWEQRLWWLAVAASCVLLVETALYLTGTPLAADYVQGVQGRYFLPVLPLALLALMPERGFRHTDTLFAACACLLLAIGLLTALDSFWIHGFTSIDGMPPHGSPFRTLLLPSPRW